MPAAARSALVEQLMKSSRWGLDEARAQARRLLAQPDRRRVARQLVAALSTDNSEQRVRAADVARRITEKDGAFLTQHAADLAVVLAEMPIAESRARWHLGLVVARSARTSSQIGLAAEVLWQLSEDESNVVRSSAVEGLGLLAQRDASLRPSVEPFLHHAVVSGTPAMRVRARNALCRLQAQSGRRSP